MQLVAQLHLSRWFDQSDVQTVSDSTLRHDDRLIVGAHLNYRGHRLEPCKALAPHGQLRWSEAYGTDLRWKNHQFGDIEAPVAQRACHQQDPWLGSAWSRGQLDFCLRWRDTSG